MQHLLYATHHASHWEHKTSILLLSTFLVLEFPILCKMMMIIDEI